MPQSNVIQSWTSNRLVPLYHTEDARIVVINLPPGKTYKAGTVMAQVADAANDVQTIADTGTVSGGTFKLSGTDPITGAAFTTAAIAYNAANSAVKSALELVLSTGITATVAGSGLPTNDTTVTFSGAAAGRPVPALTVDNTAITGGGTLGVTHTTTGRSAKTFDAYADGSIEPARGLLEYDYTTDAMGRVTFADSPLTNYQPYATMYITGIFATEDLTGLDDHGVADLAGHLSSGTVTQGTLVF